MNVREFEGHRPEIDPSVYVDPAALVIGAVRIGADSSLWPMSVARGDVNEIVIGARSNVQDASVIHVTHDGPWSPGGITTEIGDDVTVGHMCVIHACRVGHRCLVGMGSVIMDGAVLEDDVMLAAGSLVAPGKRLKGGWLHRGRPARPMRALRDEELEMLRYSAAHYVRLKDRHLGEAR